MGSRCIFGPTVWCASGKFAGLDTMRSTGCLAGGMRAEGVGIMGSTVWCAVGMSVASMGIMGTIGCCACGIKTVGAPWVPLGPSYIWPVSLAAGALALLMVIPHPFLVRVPQGRVLRVSVL